MPTQFQKFKELHHQKEPLILGNVWNVQSAKVLEKMGYSAIGTSSYAVAETLGYEDGEKMPFEEYYMLINRIVNSTSLPLSVDLESGFGATDDVVIENLCRLSEIGVVGINIEDSAVTNSGRNFVNSNSFTNKLNAIRNALNSKNIAMFINVRCDAFLLNVPNKVEEAKARIQLYETANIDGIFLPCITDENEIADIVGSIKSPLNVLGLPTLPDFDTLQKLGVKRISIGNYVNEFIYKEMEKVCHTINESRSFSVLFQ
jgi:2-methylisocitrate lyase-like PEP mutase family enzyme